MEIKIYEWLGKPLVDIIDKGLPALITAMISFAILLALFDFILATMQHQDTKQVIITRMIKYAFFLGVLSQYIKVKEVILDGFVSFTSIFTGSEIKIENITDSIVHESLKNLNTMFNESNVSARPSTVFDILFLIIVYVLCVILLVWVLYKVLLSIVQFHIVLALAIIFIPCFLFEGLRNIGERFLDAVFSAGIKLTVLIIVQQVAISVLVAQPVTNAKKGGFWSTVTFGFLANIDLSQIIVFLTVFVACAMIILLYENITSFLISGRGETISIKAMIAEASKRMSQTQTGAQFIGKGARMIKKVTGG